MTVHCYLSHSKCSSFSLSQPENISIENQIRCLFLLIFCLFVCLFKYIPNRSQFSFFLLRFIWGFSEGKVDSCQVCQKMPRLLLGCALFNVLLHERFCSLQITQQIRSYLHFGGLWWETLGAILCSSCAWNCQFVHLYISLAAMKRILVRAESAEHHDHSCIAWYY